LYRYTPDDRIGEAHLPHEQAGLLVEVQLYGRASAVGGPLHDDHILIVNAARTYQRSRYGLLDSRRKGEHCVQPDAIQVSTRIADHRKWFIRGRRSHPSIIAIASRGPVSEVGVHDHGALIWSLHINVHRRLGFRIPFVRALEDDAGDRRCFLRSSDCLEILVKDLIGGRRLSRLPSNLDFIGIERGRLAVLVSQSWRVLGGAFEIAMARVAGHDARSPEIRPIDVLNHQNHPACGRLAGSLLGVDAPIALDLRFDMAINTVIVRRCGNEPHGVHEFIDRDSLEHRHVLEGLFRHQWPCSRSLTRRRCTTQR
jgi:hypothetical protein